MLSVSMAGLIVYVFLGLGFWQFLCWWEYKKEKDDKTPEYWEQLMRWRLYASVVVMLAAFVWACAFN